MSRVFFRKTTQLCKTIDWSWARHLIFCHEFQPSSKTRVSHAHWLIICCCVCFVHSMIPRATAYIHRKRLLSHFLLRNSICDKISRPHTIAHTKGVITPNTWLRSMVYLRFCSCFFFFFRQAPPAQHDCSPCWFAAVDYRCAVLV